MTGLRRMALLLTVSPLLIGLAPLNWPDSYLSRVELLALLQTLNAELLSHPSATLTLERWCGAHHMASETKVVARLVRGAEKTLDADGRNRLAITGNKPIRYRHVQLYCGDKLLSEADNWYVPSRLTPEMNRLLDETDTPFGKVVKDLGFRRETLSATLLWSPLAEGWEMLPQSEGKPGSRIEVPDQVLQHRAVLYTRANTPFSLVIETYTRDVLAFTPPPPQ
jgi:hypothetical protein